MGSPSATDGSGDRATQDKMKGFPKDFNIELVVTVSKFFLPEFQIAIRSR